MKATIRATGQQVDVYRDRRIPGTANSWRYCEFGGDGCWNEDELTLARRYEYKDTSKPLPEPEPEPMPIPEHRGPGRPRGSRKKRTAKEIQQKIEARRLEQFRYGMIKKGYIWPLGRKVAYYTQTTNRTACRERNAVKHGIMILPWIR